jgi:hypothetical protein
MSEREEPEEEERLDPDRPHLPEASTTVGKGRIVLESGYTFTGKGSTFSSHAYPEALLRIGMFADWFEFRVGQNFLSQAHTLMEFGRVPMGIKPVSHCQTSVD